MTAKLRSIDLTKVLDRWSKAFIRRMRQGLTQQKGIDNKPFEPLSARTLADRKRRGVESTKRLLDTRSIYNGLESTVEPLRLEVGVSGEEHKRGKGASIDQVGAWNQNKEHPKPHNPDWFGVPDVMARDAVDSVVKEIEKQLTTAGVWDTYHVRVSV